MSTKAASAPDLAASLSFADGLVAEMTLAEKAGQMAQVDQGAISPDEVAEHAIGSVLSGGGGNPDPNTTENWRDMVGGFLDGARRSRLGIPLLYGTDAVHGHSNVVGATIFPHNVGLGATRDADLVERVFRATAVETAATRARWAFAPTVAVSIDPRWGRSYEAFSDDPALVAELGAAAVRGLQGPALDDPSSVLACAKHFAGDGGTAWGTAQRVEWNDWWDGWGPQWHIDQGDTRVDEAEMRSVHLHPYEAAVRAGALSVMASYSSWNGDKLHAHRYLLTEFLKGELGFQGFVGSDWLGIDQLDPDPYTCVVEAVGAGIDMVMVPFEYRRFIDNLVAAVEAGDLDTARLDDAVRRIVAVKHAMGLFDEGPGVVDVTAVGSPEHRDLAAEAAAASAVLLHNAGEALPLTGGSVLVAGSGADDMGLQCGGWTIEWQGAPGPITPGTTILEGLRSAPGLDVRYEPDGQFDETAPVGVVVVAERPYAEGRGDRSDLALSEEHAAIVARLRDHVDKLVLVVLSGRPLLLDSVLDKCDAIVAAWLPGTEGSGIADVLVGARPFRGRLPRRWPADAAQVADPQGDWEPRWDRGHGLTL